MNGISKQRKDADNAFLKVKTRSSIRDRMASEAERLVLERDAKTARLKEQRLAKEAADREAATPQGR
ncbi:hypothetical protein DK26_08690 [Bosea sp. WAO]|uniref:hypothetical protein n=1 Tax=Bosea sp. WAO TaxID=406341 RepID=UPI0007460080|nr:hypothetical protein [Bosea sp. WAO]KUL96074.1 hypothetical protein DK26_08690 [Bosea sp. WAO]